MVADGQSTGYIFREIRANQRQSSNKRSQYTQQVTITFGKILTYCTQSSLLSNLTYCVNFVVGEAKLTPFSLEYDWVGDNVYFLDYNLGACLCGRATETCTIVMAAKEFPCFSADIKIAVDPPNG